MYEPFFELTTMEMPTTMTPTLMPTALPTILNAALETSSPTTEFPNVELTENNLYFKDNMTWMVLWFITLILFIVAPFFSKRRRILCMRGIRERRWISEEEVEEEMRREEMQQRVEAARSQEDSIRHQYLSFLMERYTVELKASDILDEADESDMEAEEKHDIENQCEATVMSSDVGSSQDTIDTHQSNQTSDIEAPTPIRENRADSEDSDNLLACEFEKGQKVSVPLAGQSKDSKPDRRLVSNGCAICLCQFEAGEKLTYSSNPDCCHVFHEDCSINWYIAVGRKTQRKRRKNNPNMTEEEFLNQICDFPINCPCCRQQFSTDSTLSIEKTPDVSDDSVEESNENVEESDENVVNEDV